MMSGACSQNSFAIPKFHKHLNVRVFVYSCLGYICICIDREDCKSMQDGCRAAPGADSNGARTMAGGSRFLAGVYNFPDPPPLFAFKLSLLLFWLCQIAPLPPWIAMLLFEFNLGLGDWYGYISSTLYVWCCSGDVYFSVLEHAIRNAGVAKELSTASRLEPCVRLLWVLASLFRFTAMGRLGPRECSAM